MTCLTAKQQQVLDVVRDYQARTGESPSVREIGEIIGVASSCTVQRHLDALQRKNKITRGKYEYRSIKLLDGSDATDRKSALESIARYVAERVPIEKLPPEVQASFAVLRATGGVP